MGDGNEYRRGEDPEFANKQLDKSELGAWRNVAPAAVENLKDGNKRLRAWCEALELERNEADAERNVVNAEMALVEEALIVNGVFPKAEIHEVVRELVVRKDELQRRADVWRKALVDAFPHDTELSMADPPQMSRVIRGCREELQQEVERLKKFEKFRDGNEEKRRTEIDRLRVALEAERAKVESLEIERNDARVAMSEAQGDAMDARRERYEARELLEPAEKIITGATPHNFENARIIRDWLHQARKALRKWQEDGE